MQDHRVAHCDVGDAVPDRMDPAGVLVPDDVGQLGVHRLGPVAVHDVQVGAAHTRTTDLDDDVQRALELRFGDVVDLRHLVVRVYPNSFHCVS